MNIHMPTAVYYAVLKVAMTRDLGDITGGCGSGEGPS
jgi:hypothetical protein